MGLLNINALGRCLVVEMATSDILDLSRAIGFKFQTQCYTIVISYILHKARFLYLIQRERNQQYQIRHFTLTQSSFTIHLYPLTSLRPEVPCKTRSHRS